MPGKRTALLLVTDTYAEKAFGDLQAPQADAESLESVLSDPDIGGYEVETLTNAPSHEVRRRLNQVFAEASRDDLVLIYVSGHAVKDESGRLQLATTDTERKLLAATAVSAGFVRDLMDASPARKVVIWLDCCFSGAFPAGTVAKADTHVDAIDQLSGTGCAVMTASTAIQYAFEQGTSSVFTDAIVRGLRSGDADLNADGVIDAAELYSYVHDEVKRRSPAQTPTRNDQVTGELYIAFGKRGPHIDLRLPAEIRAALVSTFPQVRLGAITTLTELAATGDQVAAEVLRKLETDADPDLAAAASAGLKAIRPVRRRIPEASHDLDTPAVVGTAEGLFVLALLGLSIWLMREVDELVEGPWYLSGLVFVAVVAVSWRFIPAHWQRLVSSGDGLRAYGARQGAELKWTDISRVTLIPLPSLRTRLLVRLASTAPSALNGLVRDGVWEIGEVKENATTLGQTLRRAAPSSVTIARRRAAAPKYRGFRWRASAVWVAVLAAVTLSMHLYTHSNDPSTLDLAGCQIADVAYAKVLAVACRDAPIQLWDDGAQRLGDLTGDTGKLDDIVFNPDGTLLAGGSLSGEVRIWSVGSGSHDTLRTEGDPVQALTFSGDSTMLAVATTSNVVVWNVRTRAQLFTIPVRTTLVKFSADSQTLAIPAANGSLFYDLKGNRTKTFPGTTLWATANAGGGVSIYDVTKYNAVTTFATDEAVQHLAFGPNHTFATYGTSKSIRVWDTTALKAPTKSLPAPSVDRLRFNTTGTRLAVANYTTISLYILD
ncbi:caspase family protein [Actinocrispum sp. NPDC049592]|uniref:caspase, EACC1-associated type n=1 Tax=Actinocrispum sp. NPDC049592 TaxID=3154835 RepID=UPI00342F642A